MMPPFPEMEGDIIPVDYELSSWKYQNKGQEILHTQPSGGIMITKTILQPDGLFELAWKGSGSAYGGPWKPKKPGDERFLGKPGEIKVTYDKHGIKRWTKIGSNGRATMERHFGDHNRDWCHTNPHDHVILWDANRGNPLPQGPINYPNGAPEFKQYAKEEYSMNQTSTALEGNSFEEDRFQSISEFKWCVNDGGEVEFEWKGKAYSITHPEGKINIGEGCYQKNGKYYNVISHTEYVPGDGDLWGDTADEILEYNMNGDKLRDVVTQIKVWSRSI